MLKSKSVAAAIVRVRSKKVCPPQDLRDQVLAAFPRRPWSEQDIDRLKYLYVVKHSTVRSIATTLRRTLTSVRQKLHSLGVVRNAVDGRARKSRSARRAR